ncbi:hypothetical protein N8T08_008838 [Aspergillus melleus]|uniref:Uncharacterized protein n=1 Tax=Aspergillus melleus TaxID=138277 RepID=A0ACC3AVG3_9EURO|nr:hypothetical protein N8T08_008838 [Aspergillus melleus]
MTKTQAPTLDESLYNKASGKLGLCLLQELDEISSKNVLETLRLALYLEVLGAGKDMGDHAQIQFAKALEGEGNNRFQNINRLTSLLSLKVFDSLLMVDFCNPVYSWKREVLMQYVPTSTALSDQGKYDLETKFITALQKSPWAERDGQPECEFLNLYRNYDLDGWFDTIAGYSKKVKKNMEKEEYVVVYMELAESRRRIYRPLPLDEFGFTLPFATKYDKLDILPLKGITVKAEVVDMPTRGMGFITAWTGTLWTNNPEIVALESNPPLAPGDLPKPERTPVGLGTFSARKKTGGCPVVRKRH